MRNQGFLVQRGKEIGNFAPEKAKLSEQSRMLGAMHAAQEDTSWEKRIRKHIAFGTTHEFTYIKFWRLVLSHVKNYIADFYFSEPNFEYVKDSLT